MSDDVGKDGLWEGVVKVDWRGKRVLRSMMAV
jgi:hypothetical protein